MRVKIDENLPAELAEILRRLGHEADSVVGEGMGGFEDADVWRATQEARRFFITQDKRFCDIRRYRPGAHNGILVLRMGDPYRRAILQRVRELFLREPIGEWGACLIIANERRVRVVHPGHDH